MITADEAAQIRAAEAARMDAIQVDTFGKDEYYRDTLVEEEQPREAEYPRAANQ